jgi:hypothetical protein
MARMVTDLSRQMTTECRGDGTCCFREEQRFSQWWLYLLLGGVAAGTTILFSFGIFKQLVHGQPWGDRPMSYTELANGKRVLVGSQRAGELADAIRERMQRAGRR